MWLGLVEGCTAFTDVDQKRIRSKFDKPKSSSRPPVKGNAVILTSVVPSASSIYEDVASRVLQAMYKILAMNWRVMEIDKTAKLCRDENYLWIKCKCD